MGKDSNRPFAYPEFPSDYDNDMRTDNKYCDALKEEVGGNHYKKCSYQPIELMEAVGMFSCVANILKYIVRYKDKGGKEDLKKILHYCQLQQALGGNWYEDTDYSADEFYEFIKCNQHLDDCQIRCILAIEKKDMEEIVRIVSELLKN